MGRFERFVAWRYLKNPRQGFVSLMTFFSFLGIMLGVATLIVVMAVMNGFRHELLGKLVATRGHVLIQDRGPVRLKEDKMLFLPKELQQEVILAYPLVERQVVLSYGGQTRGVVCQGLTPADWHQRPLIQSSLKQGSSDALIQGKVIVGSRLAQSLSLTLGSRITVIVPGAIASAFGSLPRQQALEVGGIFEIGMHDFDKNFIFLGQPKAQEMFGIPADLCSHWEIFLKDPDQAEAFCTALQKNLGTALHATSWHHNDHAIFQAVEIEKNVMFIILTLIIVIAAFNIITSLTMMVKDKVRDIAILRTMGASQRQILCTFLMTGGIIGWVGTLFGVLGGVAFAKNIEAIRQVLQTLLRRDLFRSDVYYLSKLPAVIIWSEVAVVVAITLSLSLLATLYPAYRASRLDPVEALRL